jgi:hypothetical protein
MFLFLQSMRFVSCTRRQRMINLELAAAPIPAGEVFTVPINSPGGMAYLLLSSNCIYKNLKRREVCRGKILQRKIKINLEERTPAARQQHE